MGHVMEHAIEHAMQYAVHGAACTCDGWSMPCSMRRGCKEVGTRVCLVPNPKPGAAQTPDPPALPACRCPP